MRKCSGCIITRKKNGKTQVLMVKSSDGSRWTHPKGGIERGMSAEASAAKEVYEEAGIVGATMSRLGKVKCYNRQGIVSIELFHMECAVQLDQYPEAHCRERRWVSVRKAILLTKKPLRAALKLAVS